MSKRTDVDPPIVAVTIIAAFVAFALPPAVERHVPAAVAATPASQNNSPHIVTSRYDMCRVLQQKTRRKA